MVVEEAAHSNAQARVGRREETIGAPWRGSGAQVWAIAAGVATGEPSTRLHRMLRIIGRPSQESPMSRCTAAAPSPPVWRIAPGART